MWSFTKFLAGQKKVYSQPPITKVAFCHEKELIDVEFVLLLSAYVVAIDEFKGLVEDLERLQVQLAWLAATFSFFLGVFTWIFIMRRISKLDFESRELLSFVPTRLLLKNLLLKKYLVSTAKSKDTFAKSLLR